MKKKTSKEPDENIKILDLTKKEDIKEFEKEVKELLENFEFVTVVHF